jgi:hypothetical protein
MGKTFLALSFVVLVGLASGCHYGSDDDHRGTGYYGRNDTYRDGFRDGRTYERRRSGWGYSRYDNRYWR